MIHKSLLLLIVFLISVVGTYLVRFFALRSGFVDSPNTRSSHATPVPTGGGVAIVFSILCSVLLLFSGTGFWNNPLVWIGLIPLSLSIIGVFDDIFEVSQRYRFSAQLFLALYAAYLIGGVPPIQIYTWVLEFPFALSVLFSAVGIIWMANLFNFMDGIDGISAIETTSVSICLALLVGSSSPYAWFLYSIAAASLGFLVFNWSPAKIFMGDAGSLYLGFFFACLILLLGNLGVLNFWSSLTLLGVFVSDATTTVFFRFLLGEQSFTFSRGEPWYKGHKLHGYQMFVSILEKKFLQKKLSSSDVRTKSHRFVSLGCLLINVFWLFPFAWLMKIYPNFAFILFILCHAPLVFTVITLRKHVTKSSA